MKNHEKKDRWFFLDILRVAAACAVVLLHTITGVMDITDMSGYAMERKVFLVGMDLTTWSVPLFIIISGYLFLNPAKELSWKVMLKKYCRRILLALLVFGVPYTCLELVIVQRSFRIGMLWEAVWRVIQGKSWSHMWYLYLILLLYLLTPLLKRLLAKVPKWSVWIFWVLLFVGSSVTVFVNRLLAMEILPVLPDDTIYLFYYLCGYLLAAQKGGLFRTEREDLAAVAAILLLCAGMAASRIMVDSYQVRMAYNYPPTVVLSILLFITVQRGETKWRRLQGSWLRRGATVSFTIYLIHPVFLNIMYKFIYITPLDFPLYLSLPLFYGMTLGLSVAGAGMLYKIPLLRKYVL